MFYTVYLRMAQENLQGWINEAKQFAGDSKIAFVVVANKADKKRRLVPETEAKAWAEKNGYGYFETSANTGQNVFPMFEYIFKEVVKNII